MLGSSFEKYTKSQKQQHQSHKLLETPLFVPLSQYTDHGFTQTLLFKKQIRYDSVMSSSAIIFFIRTINFN